MREIPFTDLRVGMVLGREVAPERRVLFPAGTVVKPSTVNLLRQRGVKKVVVLDPEEVDPPTKEKMLAVFRDALEVQTGSILDRLREGVSVSREAVTSAVEGVFSLIDADRRALVNLYHVAGDESYLYAHSINTAILAAIVARTMGWEAERTAAVALGALLHDVGMLSLPADILAKPGRLTAAEWEMVKRHPDLGVVEAERIAEIHPVAIRAIAEHQERMDGSGYPKGLSGDQIAEEARLVALCDVYEALTSPRPYRGAAIERDVMRRMAADANAGLDGGMMQHFLRAIPIYPPGARVRLSNGRLGTVIGATGNPFRPVIAVDSAEGQGASTEIDLLEPRFFRLYVREIVEMPRAEAKR